MEYVVINYLGKRGGGPLYALEMTKGLAENGLHTIAIIPDNIENLSDWEYISNCIVIKVSGYGNSYFSLIKTVLRLLFTEGRRIKKICKGLKIKCIYVPMIQPLTILINSFFKHKEIITTLHDPIPHKGAGRLLVLLYNMATRQSDKIIVLSKQFVDITASLYKKKSKDIYVIPHGIFDNYKKIYDSSLRHKYDNNKVNFLFFGRITPYKGLDVLADAFKKLESEFDNVALTVVGNGDFEPYKGLYSEIKNVTVVNRWIKDEEVYGFYDKANVITVLPYIEATQSGVIPVAMANDSLVICTNTGGLVEQVVDKETGYIVEAGDSNALYTVMKNIVKGNYNPLIIENAKEYISGLTWDSLALKLKQVMED